MQRAAAQVLEQNHKVRSVAKDLNICHVTFYRFVKRAAVKQKPTCGYSKLRQIFTLDQERELAEYVKTASNIYYGLNPRLRSESSCMNVQKYMISASPSRGIVTVP